MPLALLKVAQEAAQGTHPLAGTVAEWMWLLPALPLVGFVINAALSLVPVYHAGPADPSHDEEAGHTDTAHEDEYDRQTVSFHARYNRISSIVGSSPKSPSASDAGHFRGAVSRAGAGSGAAGASAARQAFQNGVNT